MKKVDVIEFAEMTGKTARHIRNLCKEGRLPCQKISISTGEKYFIYIETDEAKEMLNREEQRSIPSPQNQPEEGREEQEVVNAEFTTVSGEEGINYNTKMMQTLVEQVKESQRYFIEYNQQLSDLNLKLVSYAELAGQAKLLTDSEHRTKEEYFQIVQENKTLAQEKAELRAKMDLLKEQNKKLEEQLNGSGLKRFLKKL